MDTSRSKNLVIVKIYCIGYITIKEFGDCENIGSVNPLKNDKKYLILDLTDKYEEVCSGIRSEIKILNIEKEMFYKKNAKVGINSDDDLP